MSVAQLSTTRLQLRGLHPFHAVHVILKARMLKWLAIPFSSGPHLSLTANLDSILKSRDITMPTKVHPVKAMLFPIVTYGCESWTIKKAECWRIDAFQLWCWRRLLRVPLNAKRSKQSILKEIRPDYSLEGLMLKLKLQYFGYLMQSTDALKTSWCWETWKAGGEGGDRRWDGWMTSATECTWVWASSGSWWWTGRPGVL